DARRRNVHAPEEARRPGAGGACRRPLLLAALLQRAHRGDHADLAMPLPIPHLDDRTFDDLVAEGRSLIPRYSATWTNFNVSDPGITLMELLAYLVESAIFELDQVPPETIVRF